MFSAVVKSNEEIAMETALTLLVYSIGSDGPHS